VNAPLVVSVSVSELIGISRECPFFRVSGYLPSITPLPLLQLLFSLHDLSDYLHSLASVSSLARPSVHVSLGYAFCCAMQTRAYEGASGSHGPSWLATLPATDSLLCFSSAVCRGRGPSRKQDQESGRGGLQSLLGSLKFPLIVPRP
jgi:hypothetical protein